jgi:spore coat polysaccharide biosynthesis protein SpsF (cytidylyltransferase family)
MRLMAGKPMLQHVVERVLTARVSHVIIATTDRREDYEIVDWCKSSGYHCVAWNRVLPDGHNDVLGRFVHAMRESDDQVFMRVTGDCPLWCPILGNEVIDAFFKHSVNLCSNVTPKLDGFDTEVFTRAALLGADRMADTSYDRQHVTPFLYKRTSQHWVDQLGKVGGLKLSVDIEDDFQQVSRTLEHVENASWVETVRRYKELQPNT